MKRLDISNTDVSDASLKFIGESFPELVELNVVDCYVLGDEGLMQLLQLKKLNYVIVSEDSFSDNAISKLRLSRWTPGDGYEVSIQER